MSEKTSTISLCMIVKDEAENLDRCLASAQPFVDEIIVVDTGSRDETPAIARRYGAKVTAFPWQEDFAQARNAALDCAAQDWVLILDADEELPAATGKMLRSLTGTPAVEAWQFTIVNRLADDDEAFVTHPALRLFRNRPAYRFSGPIHEQVLPAILQNNPDEAVKHANLTIIHYGYQQDVLERRQKPRRNRRILEQAVAAEPDNLFHHYNLAVCCYLTGDLAKARQHYEFAFERLDTAKGFESALYRDYCVCLYEMGDLFQARMVATEGLIYYPDYPELHYLLGRIYRDLRLKAQAKACFENCTRFVDATGRYVTSAGVATYLPLINLAELAAEEADFPAAVTYLTKALTLKPVYSLFIQLGGWLGQLGRQGTAVAAYLTETFHLDLPTTAQLLFDLQAPATCLALLEPESTLPPPFLLLKAKCLLALGRFAAGTAVLAAIPDQSPWQDEALALQTAGQWLQSGENSKPGNCPGPPGVSKAQLLPVAWELSRTQPGLIDQIACLIAGSPDPIPGYLALGRYALTQDHPREAKMLLEKIPSGRQTTPENALLLGAAYIRLGAFEPAFRRLWPTLANDPENEQLAVATLAALLGQYHHLLTQGLALEPEQPVLLQELNNVIGPLNKLRRCQEAVVHAETPA
ncbi:MAG: glycosyltransferase [Heliobacteriaceae bacterium]|nr:glycosyltransferase [Heliobacteriaceae bacterium]MDD4587583.1 glycosyltransferase [Heliobacteriaceae bacterium]